MTTTQYLAALKRLGLTPYGRATAEALGLKSAQLDRLARGVCKISPTLERLITQLLWKKESVSANGSD